jgi:cobalt-zinc-cadmium efflux system membrane fusion protein
LRRVSRCGAGLVLLLAGFSLAPTSAVTAENDPFVIEVSAGLEARLETEAIQRHALQRRLRLPAVVELDEERVSRIGSGVNGRIVEVAVFRGDAVTQGDLLARVTSPELSRAQVSLLGALAEVDLQRRAVQRAADLVEAEVISQAELERRNKELFLAATSVQSHRDQLRLMGMSRAEIDAVERSESIHSEVSVLSPVAGTVIERDVSRSQVVGPGDPLFTIADLSVVRIEGQAPERESAFLAKARHLVVEIPALQIFDRESTLDYVSATVNPGSRTLTVRTRIETPSARVKPEMLATLVVVGPAEERLAVPAASVVREGNDDFVFVREGEGHFRFTRVSLEAAVDGLRAIASGLSEGDVIVVNGAFRLNSERRRRAGI